VGAWNTSSVDPRLQKMRAGVRVNSRMPVAVEWNEADKIMRAEGYTVDTSTKGCLAVIPQEFPVGQRMKLINLANNNTCEAILIWRGHEGRAGWELGLELQAADLDFWGLDF
jgi:hypothetical protein